MGILGKLKMRNLYVNPDYNPVFWDEVLLDTVLRQKNIRLLLNTHIERTVCQEDRVAELYGVQQASELAYTLTGKYFIDADVYKRQLFDRMNSRFTCPKRQYWCGCTAI